MQGNHISPAIFLCSPFFDILRFGLPSTVVGSVSVVAPKKAKKSGIFALAKKGMKKPLKHYASRAPDCLGEKIRTSGLLNPIRFRNPRSLIFQGFWGSPCR